VQAQGTQINAVFGTAFTGTVATFTATDPKATAGGFTATIDWGDGTTSTGTIAADTNGGFDVTGTHTYTDETESNVDPGTPQRHHRLPNETDEAYYVTVTIQQTSDNSSATAVSLASVTATAPKIVTASANFSATAGTAFTGTVATFTDADGDPAGHFTVSIDWGDGRHSAGTVTANSGGGFAIGGTHTYRYGGTYAVVVRIYDTDGDAAFGLSTATVADKAPSAGLGVVGSGLTHSPEYYADLIIKDYQQYLGRTPGTLEVAGWVSAYQHGATDEQVMAGFLSSPEYYQNAGNTVKTWLDAVYRDVLGRNPDAGGEQAWMQAAATGMTRDAIGLGFATSQERESQVVANDYQKYLGRGAGASEIAGWVASFQAGATNEQIAAAFVASPEYYQKHNTNAHDWLFGAYNDLLARNPDPSGLNSWLGMLHQQES
jgi:hypothetical protein